MPGIRHPLMINGVPVVTAHAEIDVTTAEQLRVVLFDACRHGHATVVVDMTRTRFCDWAGLAVLAGAHRRALAQGGGLRLVLPAGGAVARVLSFTGLDCFIPGFGTLEHALAAERQARAPPGPVAMAASLQNSGAATRRAAARRRSGTGAGRAVAPRCRRRRRRPTGTRAARVRWRTSGPAAA